MGPKALDDTDLTCCWEGNLFENFIVPLPYTLTNLNSHSQFIVYLEFMVNDRHIIRSSQDRSGEEILQLWKSLNVVTYMYKGLKNTETQEWILVSEREKTGKPFLLMNLFFIQVLNFGIQTNQIHVVVFYPMSPLTPYDILYVDPVALIDIWPPQQVPFRCRLLHPYVIWPTSMVCLTLTHNVRKCNKHLEKKEDWGVLTRTQRIWLYWYC